MQLGAARRDWLQQLRLMYSITLMRLQELCKTCASLVGFLLLYFILFWRKAAEFLHNSSARVLFYFNVFHFIANK